MAKKATLESNAAALKRWRSKLKRAINEIDKLERQQKRLTAAATKRGAEPPRANLSGTDLMPMDEVRVYAKEVQHSVVEPELDQKPLLVGDCPDIPEFLRRGKAAQEAVDKVVAEQIKAEQAETKKRKAAGRIAKMKAKQAGDLKKMPLSGRAALAAIRSK